MGKMDALKKNFREKKGGSFRDFGILRLKTDPRNKRSKSCRIIKAVVGLILGGHQVIILPPRSFEKLPCVNLFIQMHWDLPET